MTRTSFPGSRPSRLGGSALPLALVLVIALALILNSAYSRLRADYVRARKDAAAFYADLERRNARAAPAGEEGP